MRPENFTSTKSGWIVVYCAELCELNLVHFFKWTELSSIIIPRKILNLNWTKFKFCRMNLNWTVFMKKVNLMITALQAFWILYILCLIRHEIIFLWNRLVSTNIEIHSFIFISKLNFLSLEIIFCKVLLFLCSSAGLCLSSVDYTMVILQK